MYILCEDMGTKTLIDVLLPLTPTKEYMSLWILSHVINGVKFICHGLCLNFNY